MRLSAVLLLYACGGPAVVQTPTTTIVDTSAATDAAPSASDAGASTVDPSIPADLRSKIDRAQRIGPLIFTLDQAAWVATDLVKANKLEGTPRILGFLVGPRGPAWEVVFLVGQDPLKIGHRVVIAPDAKPTYEKLDPPQRADDYVPLFKARQLVIDKVGKTEQPINPVVFPASIIGEQGIIVYLLAATTKPGVVVLGRHYRARVSNDGTSILELEPLSKAPIEIVQDRLPPGAKPAGVVVSQLLTDTPLETHVFASLQHGLPIGVATDRGTWWVEGDHIRFLGEHAPH